jgi:hypothetical protein
MIFVNLLVQGKSLEEVKKTCLFSFDDSFTRIEHLI